LKNEHGQGPDPKRARNPLWFKTGAGEYGEHERFIGVSVPAQRVIAEKYNYLTLEKIEKLLKSRIH